MKEGKREGRREKEGESEGCLYIPGSAALDCFPTGAEDLGISEITSTKDFGNIPSLLPILPLNQSASTSAKVSIISPGAKLSSPSPSPWKSKRALHLPVPPCNGEREKFRNSINFCPGVILLNFNMPNGCTDKNILMRRKSET